MEQHGIMQGAGDKGRLYVNGFKRKEQSAWDDRVARLQTDVLVSRAASPSKGSEGSPVRESSPEADDDEITSIIKSRIKDINFDPDLSKQGPIARKTYTSSGMLYNSVKD